MIAATHPHGNYWFQLVACVWISMARASQRGSISWRNGGETVIHGLIEAVIQTPIIWGQIAFFGGIILLGGIIIYFTRRT